MVDEFGQKTYLDPNSMKQRMAIAKRLHPPDPTSLKGAKAVALILQVFPNLTIVCSLGG